MIYVLRIPDDLSGYETTPGDLQHALLGMIETWLGPDYEAYIGENVTADELKPIWYQP